MEKIFRVLPSEWSLLSEIDSIEREIFGSQGLNSEQLLLLAHTGGVYALREDGKLTAEAIIFRKLRKKTVFVFSFAVINGMRRSGRGSKLMNFLFNSLAKLKIKTIELTVDPQNHAALNFYLTRLQFKKKRLLLNHLGKGRHRILLIKYL